MEVKFKKYDSADYLNSDEAITAYLQEAISHNDVGLFSHALGVVARAEGMSKVAKEIGVSRESLYRSLSDDGNPKFETVLKVIHAFGLKFCITGNHSQLKASA